MSDASKSLLIKNGKVFNHDARTFAVGDVLIEGGMAAKIAPSLTPAPSVPVLDARGKLVLPGLIDFHLHCFRHGQLLGVDVDELAPYSGTTCFVDAGSCGAINFVAFNEYVIKPSAVKIFAFLNVSALGQHSLGIKGIDSSEYDDERFLHIKAAEEVIANNPSSIIGVKARMCAGLYSTAPLNRARELADAVGLPMMVHIGENTVSLETVLSCLKEGDIVTHTYHGGKDGILDDAGGIKPMVIEARDRGILFDVGLDRVHSSFAVIGQALRQGFYPDFISTDLAMVNRHVTVDMPTTVSKFMALGLPLEEAVYRSTFTAARKINRPGVSGVIQEGAVADIGIFELREGDFVFNETNGNSVTASKKLVALTTIVDGVPMEKRERVQKAPGFIAP
ncbi:MAG: amidohydrolase/deacetylase family metallohydrolase [Treponemataceae bacterium]